MNCGKRIRSARIAAGLTQKELAQKLGVSGALVGQYETGIRNPKIDTLNRIAEALSLSLSFFQGTQPFSDMDFLSEYKLPILSKLAERKRFTISSNGIQETSDYDYWKCLSANVISIIRLDLNLFSIQFTPDENDKRSETSDILPVQTASMTLDYNVLLKELINNRGLALETFFILQDLAMLDDQCIKQIQKQIKELVLDPSNIYIK